MNAETEMNQIREEVKVCQDCPLAKTRRNAVPGEGPANVEVMLIGEGPGFHENEQGKPFVGQAGKFLDELLASAGLERGEVFITNVVKCRPPSNRDPEPGELAACRKYLDRQIELLQPKIIVTLGRFSMGRFIEGGRISQIHGRAHSIEGQTVVTMYHPAAALHQPALRGDLLRDFAHLKVLLGRAPAPEASAPVQPKPIKREIEPEEPEQLSLF